ncbi:hypothetical protein [Nostoc sp. CMAA1605]|uniref:hypothetical protein n=1 Tax=Nostoc sp. CMAA1605 TaxID=2055159 RepID=UPI001F437CAC|nr:hypothetical protein [Nostoc sp. CMAA1605]
MLTLLCLEREGFLRCFSRDYNLRSLLYIRLQPPIVNGRLKLHQHSYQSVDDTLS